MSGDGKETEVRPAVTGKEEANPDCQTNSSVRERCQPAAKKEEVKSGCQTLSSASEK